MRRTVAAREAPCVTGVAVIGLGEIGRLHARTLARELVDATLLIVVDPVAELAAATAAELGVSGSASYDEVLGDPAVEAIVIATPSPLHAEMVERAAEAGKHVFCEKPLSLDVESGRRAALAARERGVRLQVGFQRRFDADFAAVRECIHSGRLGAARMLRIAHRNRVPPHAGDLGTRLGSIFIDMAIHDFDTARWLVGEIEEVSGFVTAEAALVALRFADGCLGSIDVMRRASYGFDCSVELVGTDGTIRIGAGASPLGVELLTPEGRRRGIAADHIERHRFAYIEELRHFVEHVRSGTEPSPGADDALEALKLSLLAEKCAGSS
jgi:myo-inositol 2-dehydrogenase/D-chiro-inositol 1-dehydrogenase